MGRGRIGVYRVGEGWSLGGGGFLGIGTVYRFGDREREG
jgi:hypothetical protein